MKTAFVTGASGFVGAAVCRALLSAGWSVTGQVCRHAAPPGVLPQPLDLSRMVDWSCLGERVDAVIHLAGLAHVPPGDVAREGVWRINVAPVGPLAATAGLSWTILRPPLARK